MVKLLQLFTKYIKKELLIAKFKNSHRMHINILYLILWKLKKTSEGCGNPKQQAGGSQDEAVASYVRVCMLDIDQERIIPNRQQTLNKIKDFTKDRFKKKIHR